jgi:uncharacterized membrane protein YfcA
MTPSVLVGLAFAVLATSFLSGIFGMAGGMILMGVLLLFLSVPAAMVLHAVTQAASNGWRAILWRRYIDRGILIRHVLGALLAVGLFSLLRFVPDRALVLVAMGVVPFVTMAVPERFAPRVDRAWGSELSGFVSGALQLLSGVSGPILDIFFVRTTLDRRTVVATKAACQLSTHIMKLVYFGAIVSTSLDEVGWFAMAMSVVLALTGTTLSRTVLERLTDVQFRVWTQRIVLGIGVVYLIQGAAAYMRA